MSLYIVLLPVVRSRTFRNTEETLFELICSVSSVRNDTRSMRVHHLCLFFFRCCLSFFTIGNCIKVVEPLVSTDSLLDRDSAFMRLKLLLLLVLTLDCRICCCCSSSTISLMLSRTFTLSTCVNVLRVMNRGACH